MKARKKIAPFLSDFRFSLFQTAGGETKGAGGGVKAGSELRAGSRAVDAQGKGSLKNPSASLQGCLTAHITLSQPLL